MENGGLVNQTLGKYQIRAELGRGGMAVVYRGYDPDLERIVAIKVLAPHLAWEKDFVARFLREARAAARLQHPNIVTIHDVGQEQNQYYFVMELLQGQELSGYLKEHGQLSPEAAIAMLRPLAEALDYAHGQGLVHRDIKPGNIVVDAGGNVKLMDFGIARSGEGSRVTEIGTILGTPQYMSPEQAQGQDSDARSDQYSFAVVAYEMLGGRVPFDAGSTMAILYKVTHEPLPSISQIRPDLPKGVESVLSRALAKAPEDRFSTVTAFVDTLELALSGQAVKKFKPAAKNKAASTAIARQRIPLWGWIAGSLALFVFIAAVALGLSGKSKTAPLPTSRPTATATATVTPTQTPFPTNTPDATATGAAATIMAAVMTLSAPTHTPTLTPSPTLAPSLTHTPNPTPTFRVTPAPTLTPKPTVSSQNATPVSTQPPAALPTTSPGAVVTFEQMGTWRRGDQPYGELVQSQEQVRSGSYAAKLTYNFPTVPDDFVVFIQSHGLSGTPNTFGAWVYGDGSGHYVNLWIQDAQAEIWSVHLGRVSGAGWKQMIGTLVAGQSWPSGHVSGPDNGVIDYPVKFYALVVDRPDRGPQQGQIYVDDISTWRSNVAAAPTAQATPAPGGGATPTVPSAPPGEIGRIVFTVKTGETYYLYSTDPNWSQMQEIGQTDKSHSTCASSNVATTLSGFTINLYGVNKCGITARTDVCNSPDGRYKVITNQVEDSAHTLSIYTTDETGQWAYYQGPLNRIVGIQWASNSQNVIFGVGNIINSIQAGTDGYRQVTAYVDNTWPAQLSPDGSMLYYLQAVGSVGATDVFIINLDGSDLRNLTNAPIAHKLCPRWRR